MRVLCEFKSRRGLQIDCGLRIGTAQSAIRNREVGKLIWKSAGVKLQRQPVRLRPQPLFLRSGVIGNMLGFDPRDSRFDPWLRNLRTWLNGSGACLRNKSMRVRVLPSAFFELEFDPVAQMEPERLSTKQNVAGSSPAWVAKTSWASLV